MKKKKVSLLDFFDIKENDQNYDIKTSNLFSKYIKMVNDQQKQILKSKNNKA